MKRRLMYAIAMVLVLSLTLAACAPASQSTNAPSPASSVEVETSATVNFPTRPITLVTPWAAGGSSDLMNRALAQVVGKYLTQPVVVTNRDGAGGTIATAEVARANADGYTIVLGAVGVFTTQPFLREVQYDLDDFKGVIGLSFEPIMMFVHGDHPANNIQEFIEWAKEQDTVDYGHSGAGGLPHLSQAAFFGMAGIDAADIPFGGGAPTITAVLGKHVDAGAAHPGELLPHFEAGSLKPLGVFSPERVDNDPSVETFKENGFDLDWSVWKFLLVPKDTPQDVVDILHDGFKQVLEDPEFIQMMDNMNLDMEYMDGEEVVERLKRQRVVSEQVMKDLGLIDN